MTRMIKRLFAWLDERFPAKGANCCRSVTRRQDVCCSSECFDRYMQGVY